MILVFRKEYYKPREKMTDKITSQLKVLSYYQIAGGIIGLGLTIWLVITLISFQWLLLLLFLIAFLLYAFSIYCGVMLLRNIETGLRFSKINQFLQIIHFTAFGYAFQYVSGIYLSVGIDLTTALNFTFNFGISSWQIKVNSEDPTIAVSLNLVALFLIIFIDKARDQIKVNHLKNSILEVGQKSVDET